MSLKFLLCTWQVQIRNNFVQHTLYEVIRIKQQILNEQAEIQAVDKLVSFLHNKMQISFDYNIKGETPQSLDSESKNWAIPLTVNVVANKNIQFCKDYFIKTLQQLSLSNIEVEKYNSLDKKIFQFNINGDDISFRREESLNLIESFCNLFRFYVTGFKILDGIGESECSFTKLRNNWNTISNYDRNFSIDVYGFFKKNENEVIGNQVEFYRNGKITFPLAGDTVAHYIIKDIKELQQLRKTTGYIIKPTGVRYPFKNGGLVVFEKNGHGLVVSFSDVGFMDNFHADEKCKSLNLNGYHDWRLPTYNELKGNIVTLLFWQKGYETQHLANCWMSNTRDIRPNWTVPVVLCTGFDWDDTIIEECISPDQKIHFKAVRNY